MDKVRLLTIKDQSAAGWLCLQHKAYPSMTSPLSSTCKGPLWRFVTNSCAYISLSAALMEPCGAKLCEGLKELRNDFWQKAREVLYPDCCCCCCSTLPYRLSVNLKSARHFFNSSEEETADCSVNSRRASELSQTSRRGHRMEAVPLSLHQFVESYFCHYASVCVAEPINQSGTLVCDFPDVTAEM